MKHYNHIKNLILALLVGFVYYKYIVPSVPVLEKLFALAFVCMMVLSIMETLDAKRRAKVRARREKRQKMKDECAGSLGKTVTHSIKLSIRLYTNRKGMSNVRKRKEKEIPSDCRPCTRY